MIQYVTDDLYFDDVLPLEEQNAEFQAYAREIMATTAPIVTKKNFSRFNQPVTSEKWIVDNYFAIETVYTIDGNSNDWTYSEIKTIVYLLPA